METSMDLDAIIEKQGWPERGVGEPLEDYMGRCFVPVPRYDDDTVVEPGSVSCWGTVEFVEVEVSDGGWGNWMLHIAETSTVIDGSLNQRVPRGVLVEGEPASVGDVLWSRDPETLYSAKIVGIEEGKLRILWEDGLAGVADPSELSWKSPDSMERIREDARTDGYGYWGCKYLSCINCPTKVGGKTPAERYGASDCWEAQKLDLISRTEEVCGR